MNTAQLAGKNCVIISEDKFDLCTDTKLEFSDEVLHADSWFFSNTMLNRLKSHPHCMIVLPKQKDWQESVAIDCQFLKEETLAFLDGFTSELTERKSPQNYRRLYFKVMESQNA